MNPTSVPDNELPEQVTKYKVLLAEKEVEIQLLNQEINKLKIKCGRYSTGINEALILAQKWGKIEASDVVKTIKFLREIIHD
jgi:hypothetical protein